MLTRLKMRSNMLWEGLARQIEERIDMQAGRQVFPANQQVWVQVYLLIQNQAWWFIGSEARAQLAVDRKD